MRKRYTDQIELSGVQDYWDGKGGLKAIAQTHEVGVPSLRKWVAELKLW